MNNITVLEITIDELETLINRAIKKTLIEYSLMSKTASENRRYYTRREVSKMLSVSLPTLHLWAKTGELPNYHIGGRVVYKMSDIESKLEVK